MKNEYATIVSVILPCRNELKYISSTVRAIYENDYPNLLIEVIIVDGMSDDGTRNLFPDLQKEYQSLKVLDNVKQKTPYAFNLGIKNASGDIIIICGSRFILSKNYLYGIVEVLNNNLEIGCVGGKMITIYENKTSKIISKAMISPFGVGFNNSRIIESDEFVDTVTPPAFRKSIFDELGYFDEVLTRNQDDDFSYRIIKAGYKILLKSSISFEYFVRPSFSKLFKQYKQYGYWKVYVNKKHKTITTLRQLFPVMFLISIPLFIILIFLNFKFIFIFLLEIIAYLLLNFYFAFETNGFKLKQNLMQMYACFLMHLSYGSGYLEGIIDFLVLNKQPNKTNETLSR